MRLPAQVTWLSPAEVWLLTMIFVATVCENCPQEAGGVAMGQAGNPQGFLAHRFSKGFRE